MKKLLLMLAILVLAIPAFAQEYIVEEVIDIDTLKLQSGEIVRLIGVGFPDFSVTEGSEGEVAAKYNEAIEFIRSLVKDKEVKLEFDVKKQDKKGRLLAYVWYEIGPNSPIADYAAYPWMYIKHDKFESWPGELGTFVFLNATIIRAGHASPVTRQPNVKYSGIFQELYKEAREHKRGIWKDEKIAKKCEPDKLYEYDTWRDNLPDDFMGKDICVCPSDNERIALYTCSTHPCEVWYCKDNLSKEDMWKLYEEAKENEKGLRK